MKGHLREFWTDGRIVVIASLFVLFGAISFSSYLSYTTWICMVAGVLSFFVIEYMTHRFILHGLLKSILPKAHEGHEKHHHDPTDIRYLLTPNSFNIPGHLFLWIVFCLSLHSIHKGSAVSFGVALYQLDYEWTHFISHRPIIPLTRFGKWMKKYHLLHHYKNPQYWFGVTNPALDVLIGTNPEPKQVQRAPHDVSLKSENAQPSMEEPSKQWL